MELISVHIEFESVLSILTILYLMSDILFSYWVCGKFFIVYAGI